MGKGTPSFGKKNHKNHALCPRCGRRSYHIQKQRCASCAWPAARMRKYNWSHKAKRRRTQGTGREKYLKLVRRRLRNGFQHGLAKKKVVNTSTA